MPLVPNHKKKAVLSRRVFVGRAQELSRFKEQLKKSQKLDEYRILNWFGVGGQGKTALSLEFERIVRLANANSADTNEYVSARVSFEDSRLRRIDQAMLAIRLQMARNKKLFFPCFDVVFARYFMLTNPGVDIRSRHPELFARDNDILNDLAEASETGLSEIVTDLMKGIVPLLNLLVKYSARLAARSREWFRSRGKTQLEGLDELSADELLLKLPMLFGADLLDEQQKNGALRPVVLLDGYEALWKGSGFASGEPFSIRVDSWVRSLVEDTPGTLFVVLGRDELNWKTISADWGDVLTTERLVRLSNTECERFLKQMPIGEKAIRDTIIKNAAGLPFYLNLQADIYFNLLAVGRHPKPDDFGRGSPEVLARFFDHLARSEQDAITLASYPPLVQKETLDLLFREFDVNGRREDWGEFSQKSFIIESTGFADRLVMHELMRSHIQRREAELKPDRFCEIHEFLYRLQQEQIPKLSSEILPSHEENFKIGLYHWSVLPPPKQDEWPWETKVRFEEAGRFKMCLYFESGLLKVCKARFGEDHPLATKIKSEMARHLGQEGDLVAAKKQYLEVLSEMPEVPTEDWSWHQIFSVRATLAEQMSFLGEHHEALRINESLKEETEGDESKDPGQLIHSASIYGIAKQYRIMGRLKESATLFLRVHRSRMRQDGFGPESFFTYAPLLEYAISLSALGKHLQAKRALSETLEKLTRIVGYGSDHPHVLTARMYLASEDVSLGGFQAGLEALQEILSVQKRPDVLGENHPYTLVTERHIAEALSLQSKHIDALALLERVQRIWESPNKFGVKHPDSIAIQRDIANELSFLGKYKASLFNYRRAWKKTRKYHPRDLTDHRKAGFLKDCAEQYRRIGRHTRALKLSVLALHYSLKDEATQRHVSFSHSIEYLIASQLACLGYTESAVSILSAISLKSKDKGYSSPSGRSLLEYHINAAQWLNEAGLFGRSLEFQKSIDASFGNPNVYRVPHYLGYKSEINRIFARVMCEQKFHEMDQLRSLIKEFGENDQFGDSHPDGLYFQYILHKCDASIAHENVSRNQLAELSEAIRERLSEHHIWFKLAEDLSIEMPT